MKKISECVSPGHPDKVADLISQYILDRYIEQDPYTRYAVEVLIKGDTVHLAGEVTSKVCFSYEDYNRFVFEALCEIGYTPKYYKEWGGNTIDPVNMYVTVDITAQSSEISVGVNNEGWGDQGIFFGYADINDNEHLMPFSHSLAKNLCSMLYKHAKNWGVGGLDIKTEIVLGEDNELEKVIAAVPCRDEAEHAKVLSSIIDWCKYYYGNPTIILNGTGIYKTHGPVADCGVTGRKLAVDFYGGEFQVGGGAVVKDGTKADVSLNLYARKLALKYARERNESVKVSLACCIGKSEVDYSIETPCGDIIETGVMDLKPRKVITELGLDKPIYFSMHNFGLFGEFQRDKEWEK